MCPQPISFSVVIPAHNEERLLPRAIRSTLAQTYPALEVIVVDDGSRDRTAEVARSFGPPVRCVRQENKGLAAARNTGIREAQAEFVALLDADDEWLLHHLERAAAVLGSRRELHWFFAGYERRKESGETEFRRSYRGPLRHGACIEDYFRAQARDPFSLPSVAVVRRRIALELGGFDESIRKYGEDRDLWFRIALCYPQVGYSREVAAIYWGRAGSIMAMDTGPISARLLGFVQREDRLAAQAGLAAARRSEPLLLAWLDDVIRRAIRENDQTVLTEIRRAYGRRLKPWDKLLLLVCRILPNAAIRQVESALIAAKRCIRQWWSKMWGGESRPSRIPPRRP
jgi:glycosyltransferase involved in cell wall biosynthesis